MVTFLGGGGGGKFLWLENFRDLHITGFNTPSNIIGQGRHTHTHTHASTIDLSFLGHLQFSFRAGTVFYVLFCFLCLKGLSIENHDSVLRFYSQSILRLLSVLHLFVTYCIVLCVLYVHVLCMYIRSFGSLLQQS